MRGISASGSFKLAGVLIVCHLTILCSKEIKKSSFRQKFYVAVSKHRMIEMVYLSTDDEQEMVNCYTYGDKRIIEETLKTISSSDVTVANETTVARLVDYCVNAKFKDDLSSDPKLSFQHRHKTFAGMFIYPGTKWCGAGNVAEDYNDLGPEVEADTCCRGHDHCNDSIDAFGSQYGLDNNSPVTKSHCHCDETFASCLKVADTRTSHRLGRIFFNILCLECFKKEYPIVDCIEYKGRFPFKRCQKYELDEEEDPIWQFFDARDYVPTSDYKGCKEDVLEEQKWREQYKIIKLKELSSLEANKV